MPSSSSRRRDGTLRCGERHGFFAARRAEPSGQLLPAVDEKHHRVHLGRVRVGATSLSNWLSLQSGMLSSCVELANHKAAKLLVARQKKVQASTIFQWAASMLEMRSASLVRFKPRSEARIDTLIAGFDSD